MSEKPIQKIYTANHVPAALLKVTFFLNISSGNRNKKADALLVVMY